MAIPTERAAGALRRWLLIPILAGLLLAVAPASSARAEIIGGSETNQGLWSVAAFRDADSKGFEFCSTTSLRGKYRLLLMLNQSGELDVFLSSDRWSVQEGSQNKVTLRLDTGAWRNATAVGSFDGFLMLLGRDKAFFDALRGARTLTVVGQGGDIVLNIADSGPALKSLEACLKKYGGVDTAGNRVGGGGLGKTTNPIEGSKGGSSSGSAAGSAGTGGGSADSNPFAPVPPGATADNQVIDEDIASFTALLRTAGLPSPSVAWNSDGEVAWTSGGSKIKGFFRITPVGPSGASQTLQSVVKSVAELCEGYVEPVYDKIGLYSGGQVFSGRLPCRASGFEIVFVVLEDGLDLVALINYGPLYESDLLRRVNQGLREQVLHL